MPHMNDDESSGSSSSSGEENEAIEIADSSAAPTGLPFSPIPRSHIDHCAYAYWSSLYRTFTPKARIIPLSQGFVDYLRADGILLPPDEPTIRDNDSGVFSHDSDSNSNSDFGDDGEEPSDPSEAFPEVHTQIKTTIAELGGKVTPKLNWSAPRDATWIAANSMACQSPADIYLLLKSSDFITHDLEHAYDGTVADSSTEETTAAAATAAEETQPAEFHLVLRKWFELNPSVEFRCFVRDRKLVGISQRDMNHFDFLEEMRGHWRDVIGHFFERRLRDTFPDSNYVFDVYVPPPHERVWLIDINPWAPRTDPLLFSWMELLAGESSNRQQQESDAQAESESEDVVEQESDTGVESAEEDDVVDLDTLPEIRLVGPNDPEAYSFNTPQFSAHKMPADVVQAAASGPGPLQEFAREWRRMTENA